MSDVRKVEVDITAQNQFSDEIKMVEGGTWTVEDTSSISATLTLQTKPEGAADWVDVTTKTAAGSFDVRPTPHPLRVGCKPGDFSSGTATMFLERQVTGLRR